MSRQTDGWMDGWVDGHLWEVSPVVVQDNGIPDTKSVDIGNQTLDTLFLEIICKQISSVLH